MRANVFGKSGEEKAIIKLCYDERTSHADRITLIGGQL